MFSSKDKYMRYVVLALLGLFAASNTAQADAAPSCPPVTAFGLGLKHLAGYRFYNGPDGRTEVAPFQIDARVVPMLKTGKSLSIIDLPLSHTRNDQIVVGAPDTKIGMHPAPYKEMFIMLSGSVTVTTPKFKAEMFPGSVIYFDDVGSKTGHGGLTGPCGYISLSITP
jgi:mannose-6-phosphate isomerase-like protein (cupin superfamily)